MLDFAGADAERYSSEGAVGAGVAVTADNGHARKSESEFWAYYVDDALALVAHRVVRDAELFGVCPQGIDLLAADFVGDRKMLVLGWHVVVFGCHSQIRAPDCAAADAQAFEGLRRGDLVDEMQVDVQERSAIVGGVVA